MEITNFVDKFHNIGGETPAEKKKNFNTLLENLPSDHEKLITSLTPKNYLEHLFKLKLLLKLQKIPELLQVLKSEEEYLPAKLLKNKWFCKKLAQILDENSADFVSGLLPFTSYIIRRRLIAKLAIYGTKLDTVYDEVNSRYGIHIASNLLVACSPSKIEKVLKTEQTNLSLQFQKIFYKKHPQLFFEYMKQQQMYSDESVMNCVARQDLKYFLKLVEECKVSANLGKRLTKRLLVNSKEVVVSESDKFICLLHLKTLIKVLGEEDLKKFIMNSCPSSMEELHFNSGLYKLKEKLGGLFYKFLVEIMEKKYKKNIYDFPDLINGKMMEKMDVAEREKWISIKKRKGTSEDDLIPYMKVKDSIPLIKKKIDVTSSIDARSDLLHLLIKTCRINNDMTALAEICDYVNFRHRNDNENTLRNFLYQIQNNFQLEKLEKRHWEAINSIFNILSRKGDQSFFKYDFDVKYIEFLYRHKELSDDHILQFLKTATSTLRWSSRINNKTLRKMMLTKVTSLMPELIKSGEKLEHADVDLLYDIVQWNKENPKDQLPILQNARLMESLKKVSKMAIEQDTYIKEIHCLGTIFEAIICTKNTSELRNEIIANYFLVGFRYYNLSIDFWLLKNQANIVYSNFEQFLKHMFHTYRVEVPFLLYIKKYTDFAFQQKIINHCLERISRNESSDVVFSVLAFLAPPQSFLQYIAPFYPTESKIDDEDEESRKKGEKAYAVAQSFKYASSSVVLPELIKYCKGDFLGRALESLYYLFYHSPENKLSAFINELSSKAVSVRKHSIFLTCIVGSVYDVQNLLKRFIENERNVSVQKHLFTAALKYFIKNPSEECFACVKICMKNLDPNDSESFNMLVNLRQIPGKYKSSYVVFVWEILKKKEDVDKNRPRLLSSIPSELFRDLPLEFVTEVIKDNFLKTESSCESAINDFVVSSLKQSFHKNEILTLVFGIIKQLRRDKYDTLKEEKTARELLSCFVGSLVSTLGTSAEDYDLLRNFSETWHTLFTVAESMREHLKLSFSLFYLQSEKDMLKFATGVAEFLDNLVSSFGVVVVDCFAAELKDSLRYFLCCFGDFNEEFFNFCLHLLKNWNNLVFYLLVIRLLPSKQPSNDGCQKLFMEIIQVLRQLPQESIQMLLNLYIADLE